MEFVVVSSLVAVFALVGLKLERLHITAPMAFVTAGILAFGLFEGLTINNAPIHLLAELSLIVVLFHDASTVQLRALEHDAGVPLRLLAIGFPLAMCLTFGLAFLLFPALGLAGALLLALCVNLG